MYGNQRAETEQHPTGHDLFVLSLLSGAVLVTVAVLVEGWFAGGSWETLLRTALVRPRQGLIGGAFGAGAGLLLWGLWRRTVLSEIRTDYPLIDRLLEVRMHPLLMGWISLWAGFSEELFFRGVLQPAIGLWVTAVLFVALHGYLRWGGARHLAFGALMIGLSAGLGFLARYVGLGSAMIAHAIYDFTVLTLLGKTSYRPGARPSPDSARR